MSLAVASLDYLILARGLLRQIIRESEADPRVAEPKRQLAIIESEITERRRIYHMASDFAAMTDEQLEAFRAETHAQIETLREQFTQAGLELEGRRAEAERDELLKKRDELDARLRALHESPPAQVVKLKTADMRAKGVKTNG